MTTIHLGRPLPDASRNLPEPRCENTPDPRRACRSYSVLLPVGFTVPLTLPLARCALTAPFHPYLADSTQGRQARRFPFCGTIPGVAPAGCYPAPYLHGARTFLPPRLAYSFANSGHPTVWQDGHIRFEDRCKFQVSDTNTYICMNICNLTYRLTINWLSYDKHST